MTNDRFSFVAENASQLLPFYSYMQRYVQSHQKEVGDDEDSVVFFLIIVIMLDLV